MKYLGTANLKLSKTSFQRITAATLTMRSVKRSITHIIYYAARPKSELAPFRIGSWCRGRRVLGGGR